MVTSRSARRWVIVACAVWCGGTGPGCSGGRESPSRPATAAVTGTVRLADGSPLARGFVQLEVVEGPPATVSAVVEAGRFSLATNYGDATSPGVPPGRYRFVVVPEFSREPKPVRFDEPYDFDARGADVTLVLPAN